LEDVVISNIFLVKTLPTSNQTKLSYSQKLISLSYKNKCTARAVLNNTTHQIHGDKRNRDNGAAPSVPFLLCRVRE